LGKNVILSAKTAADIDRRVLRVLRGLGDPEPPLRLEEVRELLKLDRGFYTANDPGLAREAVSRIRVGAIQVFRRPALVVDVIRKMSLKALYLPDRKRILLDGSLPAKKHRWNEAHEIGHSLLPWHEDMMHGDNAQTLLPSCLEHIEAEANYAAGRLLFLCDRFGDQALSLSPSIATVQQLHGIFGNTLSTTLYRFVETAGTERAIIGMITGHPHVSRRGAGHDPARPCRHFIRSSAFAARFSRVSEPELFGAVASYCGSQSGGPLGEAEVILTADDDALHVFRFETFFNRYDALTLGVWAGPQRPVLAMSA
jgi:hypothetical protein